MKNLPVLQPQTFNTNQPPCSTCGACCKFYSQPTSSVPVGSDETVNPSLTEKWDNWFSNFPLVMKKINGNCIAFEGEVGKTATCTINSNKPRCCSDFPIGGDRCNTARMLYGLPILEFKDF